MEPAPLISKFSFTAWFKHRFSSSIGVDRIGAGMLLLLCCCLSVTSAQADTDSERIDKVKAAFIINIARYVSWPPVQTITAATTSEVASDATSAGSASNNTASNSKAPMLICHYANNFLGEAINTIADQTIDGHPLRFTTIEHLSDNYDCNILLVPAAQLDNFKQEAIKGYDKPILTITDLTHSNIPAKQVHAGILVTLVRKGSGIGFEVNLPRSNEVGIKMSSELLRLATIVGEY